MKKRMLLCSFAIFLWIGQTFSQVVKIENGFSLSFMGNKGIGFPAKIKEGYAVSIGIDYWNHDHFNLSTQLGYLATGGKDNIDLIDENFHITRAKLKLRVDNLHVNTTFRLKCPLRKTCFYIGVGPKIDFVLGYRYNIESMKDGEFNEFGRKKVLFGLKTEIGYYSDINDKWRFDLNGAYLPDLNKPYRSRNHTFTMSIGIGYKFK